MITSGDLIVDGLKVNDPKVDERLIRQEAGMVFQQFYLFPHLTALENVMFGPLRVRGASKQAAEKQAKELLAKVGLAERAHHYVLHHLEHFMAQLRVERGGRFIKQHHLRLHRQRAGDGHTLLLAAGEFGRIVMPGAAP